MKIFGIIITSICLFSCISESGKLNKKNIFLSPDENNISLNEIKSIKIDSFLLEDVESSYLGFLNIVSDTICFIDKRFCWVFRFDNNGKFIDRKLGMGGGPMEIETGRLYGCGYLPGNYSIFIGAANDCHIFDSKYNKVKKFVIDKGVSKSISYDNPLIYKLSYGNLQIRGIDNYVYLNVYVEHPEKNYFSDRKDFYMNSKTLFKLNINTGEVDTLLGGYPPIYDINGGLQLFSSNYYDITNDGDIYVSYEADSLIYCYDKYFNPKSSFGFKGKRMNTNYPKLSVDDFIKKGELEKLKYSYYSNITFINDLNYLLRTYKRSNKESHDGLQIYKNQQMIGDIDVPKGFSIIGYSHPYIYATSGIDEEYEKIKIYKFKF